MKGLALILTTGALLMLSACAAGPAVPVTAGTASASAPSATTASATAPSAMPATPTVASASAAATQSPAATARAGAPNVLLIIADDLGVDASPCYEIGAQKPDMPRLERMCEEGLVFDTAWVNPMCTPTRSTLLSGQYGFRTDVLQVGDALDENTESIQEALANLPSAYSNAVIGKWHISGEDPVPDAPSHFGVSHYAGFLSGAVPSYFDWDYAEDGKTGHTTEYTTTWITDKAIDWIGAQQQDPWFLWLAYNAPHWPYHLPPAGLAHNVAGLTGDQADIDANPLPYFLAGAEALDTEMGRLLDSFDPATRANTTVIFVGDNGSDRDVAQAPYSADRSKFSIYDGGLHVPLVVSGAGVKRHGERDGALVNGVDIAATILALAGDAKSDFHDGISFAPALTGSSGRRNYIYSDSIRSDPFDGRPGWTVRNEQYQLIEYESGEKEFYDVLADPGESTNLIEASVPAEFAPIIQAMEAYQASL